MKKGQIPPTTQPVVSSHLTLQVYCLKFAYKFVEPKMAGLLKLTIHNANPVGIECL
jgi:hypothetical protein